MMFDYFYEAQSESYAFYRTPKVLCTDPRFKDLSADAKLLYGILLDRLELSKKNHWVDDNGRVYVYMTVRNVETALGRCHQKSIRILEELENIGLIEREYQGLCKPSRVYVKNFSAVWDAYSRGYVNHTPAGMPLILPGVCNSYPNNTDINNTEISDTESIVSISKNGCDAMDEYRSYESLIRENIGFDYLVQDHPYEKETLEEIVALMTDVMMTRSGTIRISGDEKPVEIVKSRFMKLNSEHISYVMQGLKDNPVKVRNIKAYLLASLYNAPTTISNYYSALVNHDMANGLI